MATPTETLQAWDDYISEYERNLSAKSATMDMTNAATRRDYGKQSAHLQALKQKYSYLQNYYAQYGALPADVSFPALANAGAGMYRTTAGGEVKTVVLVPGVSGTTIVSAPDFSGTLSSSSESIQTVGYQDGNGAQSGNNKYGMRLTGTSYGDTTITWTTTGTIFTGMSTSTGYYGESWKWWAASLDTNSNIELLNTTGIQINAHAFQGGTYFDLLAGTVPTETPWDYYNTRILPTINPDNAAFPDPYNPEPEKPDAELPELPGEGENGGPDIEPNDITGIGGGFGFLTQYAIRAQDIEILGKLLWAGFRTGSQQDIDKYLMNFVYNVNADTGSLNFADIMDFFVSLKMYPFPLSNVATLTAHDHHIHVGAGYTAIGDNDALPHFPNIIYTMDSYVGKISAGSVELPFWFRDYRDYSIQITLYLPYCGTVELNPGDVMGGTLDCDYYVDFCTGSCTAYVTCTSWDGHRFPVASMPGQMGADVPMSATNAGRIAARIYSDRIDYVENTLGAVKALTSGAGAAMSGNYMGAAQQGFSAFIDHAINEEKLKAGMLDRGAIAAPVLSAGGGFTSFCNPSTCYVTYRSPFYPEIDNYPDSVGTPAAQQVTIGDCSGFCQFVNVDTSGITTDADAQKQIRDALAAGIYI